MNKLRPSDRAGFTLMEILIAMAIMGILAGVGFASYSVSLQKGRDAKRKSDLGQMQRALEGFYSDNGLYPAANAGKIEGCDSGGSLEVCDWGEAFRRESVTKTYMAILPVEPKAGFSYVYVTSTDRRKYQLFARLESDKDPKWFEYETVCGGNSEVCTYGVASPNAAPEDSLD